MSIESDDLSANLDLEDRVIDEVVKAVEITAQQAAHLSLKLVRVESLRAWRVADSPHQLSFESLADIRQAQSVLAGDLSEVCAARDALDHAIAEYELKLSVLGSLVEKRQHLREQRDQLRKDLGPRSESVLSPTHSVACGEETQSSESGREQLKALRKAIGREDWDDLPPFYGSEPVRQRYCAYCDAPLREGRKRFCSRTCHEVHISTFGSALIPRLPSDDER